MIYSAISGLPSRPELVLAYGMGFGLGLGRGLGFGFGFGWALRLIRLAK